MAHFLPVSKRFLTRSRGLLMKCRGWPYRRQDSLPPQSNLVEGAVLSVETAALGIFGSAAYLAGDFRVFLTIAVTAVFGFGARFEAERRLSRHP